MANTLVRASNADWRATVWKVAYDTASASLIPATGQFPGAKMLRIEVTPTANLICTAVPNIAEGYDGQRIYVLNVATLYTFGMSDRSTVAGSLVAFNGYDCILGPGQGVWLVYSSALGYWSQLGRERPWRQLTLATNNTVLTLSAAQSVANTLVHTGTPLGVGTYTTASAANIIKALGGTRVPIDGSFVQRVRIVNTTAKTFTFTSPDVATVVLSGTVAIANKTWREYDLCVTSATVVTYTEAGDGSLVVPSPLLEVINNTNVVTVTLTAAQSIAGSYMRTGSPATFSTEALAAATAIITALGNVATDGSYWRRVRVTNQSNLTLVRADDAGATTTVLGRRTIQNNCWRDYDLNVVSASAVTYTDVGGGVLTAVPPAISAHAGGGQASATVTGSSPNVLVSTVTTAGDSVKLPEATGSGIQIAVFNSDSTDAMDVFPATGETINALAANAALSIVAGTGKLFVDTASTAWRTLGGVPPEMELLTVDVTVTTGQLLALFGTPKTLVAAPAAGFAVVPELITIYMPYATVAYAAVDAGDDLAVRYTGVAGTILATVEATGFVDQATSQTRIVRPTTAADFTPVAATPLVLHMTNSNITTGDSPLHVRVLYRVVATTF